MKKILFIISILALAVFASCSSNTQEELPSQELPVDNGDDLATGTFPADKSTSEICTQSGGTWIESANECEGISPNLCQEMGGNFNECGSACRNNPEAEICTLQCVAYCGFE